MDRSAVAHMENGQSTVLAHDLMTELTGVVPTLGGMKVTVGFGGTGAFCTFDPPYVNIPALPETDRIPMATVRQIRGFASHEAAHLAFTDPSVPIRTRDGKEDPLLHSVWNAIEDYMIERYWLELYPGTLKNFAATEAWCCDQYLKGHAKNPLAAHDLRQVGPVALTWMRALAFGLGTPGSRESLATLPVDLQERVRGWFKNLVHPVQSTQEALEAAWVVFEDILANPFSSTTTPQQKNQIAKKAGAGQPKNGAGQGQGQGQPQQGGPGQGTGTAGGTNSAGQPGAPNNQPGNTPGATGPNTAGNPTGPGAASGDPTVQHGPRPAPLPVGFDLTAALKQAKVSTSPMPIVAPVWSTKTEGPIQAQLSNPKGRKKAEACIQGMRDAVTRTAAELRRALKTIAKDRTKTGRLDGTVDSKRMAFAAMGSLEYHKKTVQGLAIDTAVSIVVDCSSSMNSGRIQVCQQMAVILEQALNGTPVQHEIIGFTTGSESHIDPSLMLAQKAHTKAGRKLNVQPVSVYLFRPFGARSVDAMDSLGAMDEVPMGGTPTSQAILLAHNRLARRKERRHVLIVLTDGQSDDGARTRRVVEAVERCGVTVLGIGINSASVRNEFRHAVVIQNARDLPALMVSTLSGILLGEKRKKGIHSKQIEQIRKVA
jgi:Cobalamin biosynthesis protein CobT VWA domain/Cobalamin biosynthesis protein CobT